MNITPNTTINLSTDGDKSLSSVMRLGGTIYYLILIIGGTLGNAIAIIAIWTNRAMSKTRLVFIVLALSDTAVLLTNPPRYCIMFLSDVDIREFNVITCKLHTFVTYLMKDVATWVLVLISFERLIATWAPYKLTKYHDSKLPIVIWTTVITILLLKNASLLFVVTIITLGGNTRRLCDCETNALTFRQAFMWVDSFVYCWVPSLCLFIFNGGIIYSLHRSRNLDIRKHQCSAARESESLPLSRKSSLNNKRALRDSSKDGSPAMRDNRRNSAIDMKSAPMLLGLDRGNDAFERPRTHGDSVKSLLSRENSSPATVGTIVDERKLQVKSKRSSTAVRSEAGNQKSLATSLLIPISIFHLVTTLPIAVLSVVEAVLQIKHGKDQALTDLVKTVGSFMVMLMCLNNGLNCLVYFISSQRFRKHFIMWLKYRGKQKKNARSLIGAPPNSNAFLGPLATVYLCGTTSSPRRASYSNGNGNSNGSTMATATYAAVPLNDSRLQTARVHTAEV